MLPVLHLRFLPLSVSIYPCRCGGHESESKLNNEDIHLYQQSTQEKHRHIRTQVLFAVADFAQRAPNETTPKYRKIWTWLPIKNFHEIISPQIWIPDHFTKFIPAKYNPYMVWILNIPNDCPANGNGSYLCGAACELWPQYCHQDVLQSCLDTSLLDMIIVWAWQI